MGTRVQTRVEQHSVRQLPVEPQVLVERQPLHLGADPPHDGAAHGQQDEHGVEAEDQPRAPGDPDGELEEVQGRQALIHRLAPPRLAVWLAHAGVHGGRRIRSRT